MMLFMIYIFYFMLCEIKNLFCFTCIFHTCVYVFVKCTGIYKLIQSCCCLHLQLIDSS